MSKLAKSKHKYGSAEYWKFMCTEYQKILKDGYERGLQLEEIPGLLTVKRVKHKELNKTKNTRVTNVHGSMEAQDILSKVEAIEKEKKEKKTQKEERHQQRNNQKELFFKCKTKCMCKGVCAAIGLKQCPVCSEVKKSVCGKAACQINGSKPVMILFNSKSKTGDDDYDDDADDDFDDGDEESDCEGDDEINEDEGNDSEEESASDFGNKVVDNVNERKAKSPSERLLETWYSLSPPTQEKDIVGKWFAGIWATKKSKKLCIGRLMKRFLDDEDGKVTAIELSCLKPRVGLTTIMEETPSHLPDIAIFKVEDIIDGPIRALPLKGKKWDIQDYDSIFSYFQEVSKLDRLALKNMSF